MKIEILDTAQRDLVEGFRFYEAQGEGLGSYFLTTLYADIASLHFSSGIHSKPYKHYHRLLSRRFPFAVFYTVREDALLIHAVLDCRRNPRGYVDDFLDVSLQHTRIEHVPQARRLYIPSRLQLTRKIFRQTQPAI